jgi:hypothetical protein
LSQNSEKFICLPKDNKRFFLAWFAESHDNVVKTLSSIDTDTDYQAIEYILHLSSNYHFFSSTSSNNSKPQYEAKAASFSNGKKNKNI